MWELMSTPVVKAVLPQDIRVHGYEEETGCTMYRNSKTGKVGRSVEEVWDPTLDMRFMYRAATDPFGRAVDLRTPDKYKDPSVLAEERDPESMATLRRMTVFDRLQPYYTYRCAVGFGSGLLQFPLLSWIVVTVCNDNPGRLAVFTALGLAFHQVPRVLLVSIHGEITDRLPRKPCIFYSYCFELGVWFAIVSTDRMAVILGLYFVRAVTNIHTFAETLYLLDLTLYAEQGDLAQLKTGRTAAAEERPDHFMLSRAVASEVGMKDIQNGTVSAMAYSGAGALCGLIVGAVVLTSDISSVKTMLYVALGVKLAAQMLVLRIPESKPHTGNQSRCALVTNALSHAVDECWAGFGDMRARLASGEKLLADLAIFMFLLLSAFVIFFFTAFMVFQYKVDPTVAERVEFAVSLIPPCGLGVFLWIRYFWTGDKAEVYAVPYYLAAIAVAFFAGAFVNSYFGYLFIMAVIGFAVPTAVIPLWAIWSSQAPINKQGRFSGVCVIIFVGCVGIPCVGASLYSFMASTGRWSDRERFHRGSQDARHDLRPCAPMVLAAIMVAASACRFKGIATRIKRLTQERRGRDVKRATARKSELLESMATFVNPHGRASNDHAADFFRACGGEADDGSPPRTPRAEPDEEKHDVRGGRGSADPFSLPDVHHRDSARDRAESSGANPMKKSQPSPASISRLEAARSIGDEMRRCAALLAEEVALEEEMKARGFRGEDDEDAPSTAPSTPPPPKHKDRVSVSRISYTADLERERVSISVPAAAVSAAIHEVNEDTEDPSFGEARDSSPHQVLINGKAI